MSEQLFILTDTQREKNGLAVVSHAIDKSTPLNTIIRHERKKNVEAIFTKVVVYIRSFLYGKGPR